HGHDHDQDNVKERDGQLYFFDSHVSGNWGTAYRGYRVLEVMKNGDILTYQMNPAKQQQVNSRSVK
ncbi:MAG: transcriptional regulator, partial [Segetibacter sp.]|nr:transcriptional regulator [Segetibacter sp.]